jgi:hypothetical protein
MGGHVWQETTEADGAETFGNRQVIFLSAIAAVDQNDGAHALSGCWQSQAAFRQLCPQDLAAPAWCAGWNGQQTWCAIFGSEWFHADAVSLLVGKKILVIGL